MAGSGPAGSLARSGFGAFGLERRFTYTTFESLSSSLLELSSTITMGFFLVFFLDLDFIFGAGAGSIVLKITRTGYYTKYVLVEFSRARR
jgi:hypothetical protein